MKNRFEGFVPKGTLIMAKKKKRAKVPVAPQAQSETIANLPEMSSELKKIHQKLENCKLCKLSKGRTHIVFGEGNPKAELMFVGEGPGETEDLQARPFVGRAGKLLDKMIEAMGVKREDVYIANIVKCRPPENRVPEDEEMNTCTPFLLEQIAAVRPKVVVALGKTASQSLLKTETPISELRGKLQKFAGIQLVPTYHPAYLLRNPSAKKDCWADLQVAIKILGWKAPK